MNDFLICEMSAGFSGVLGMSLNCLENLFGTGMGKWKGLTKKPALVGGVLA
jgi:hypothetical protein